MPGLPLTTAWAEEEAPCLFYCAAGPRLAAGAEVPQHVETSAEGCDAAMACVRSRGGDGTTGRSRGGEGSRLSDGVHWRVFTLHSQHMVVTLVASARFCSCAGREVASKVCAMVAPVAAACAASAAHSAACRALLAREVAAAHAERRGLAAPRARAAGCALCGVAFAADTLRGQNGHDATNGGRAVNCAVCGDVVCTDCATAHDGASAVPFSLRCGDCEHCMLTGRRLLRLRPQQAGDATRFALAALFGEHATDDRVDEFQFLDFVAAAARHPLVVDERSLDREARANGGMKHMVALDVDELGLSFRAACSQGEDTLDALAAQACLSRACAPQWRSLNTPQGEKDESDESGDESDAEASWALAPLHCAPDGAPLPRGLPESVDAPASKKRTGWGALASRDGTSVRVWLELDDSEPQCLTYTRHEAVFARRTLLFLRDVASIRCEEKCTLDLRRRAGGALQLRFEAPAATCSWWASLADSRHAARAEASRFAARDAASENAWPDAAPSGWYQRVASSFTRTTGLQLPGADGTAEGQERPFLSLAPLSAPSSAPLRASEPATELGDSLPERALALAGPDVKAAYQNLIKVIIRPPRAFYDEQRLGVADFSVRQKGGKTGVAVHREDLRVTNERGLEVRASIWVPIVDSEEPPPCVVFVHGNACNRLGALPLLRP